MPKSRLRPVFAGDDSVVYVVEAKPARLAPLIARRRVQLAVGVGALPPRVGVGTSGFATGLWFQDAAAWHRLVQDGEVVVDNPTASLEWGFRLRTVAFSPGRRRDVVLLAADGTALGRAAVGPTPQQLDIGPFSLPAGRSVLRLRVEPGPGAFRSQGSTGLVLRPPRLEPVLDVDLADVPETVSTQRLERFAAQRRLKDRP